MQTATPEEIETLIMSAIRGGANKFEGIKARVGSTLADCDLALPEGRKDYRVIDKHLRILRGRGAIQYRPSTGWKATD